MKFLHAKSVFESLALGLTRDSLISMPLKKS